MDDALWDSTVASLSSRNVDEACRAAGRLHSEATLDDLPKLLALLGSEDFFLREAAAWPLAELAGPSVLEHLFVAYQRGFDEGLDNDGFTAALLEIPALHPAEATLALQRLLRDAQEPVRSHAEWLLTFCAPGEEGLRNAV